MKMESLTEELKRKYLWFHEHEWVQVALFVVAVLLALGFTR